MKQVNIGILSLLTFFSCEKQKIEMVFVEGGSFTMGTDRSIITPMGDTLNKFTSPAKEVEIKDFISASMK
jgi:sulfatase modifying factor 1